MSYWRDKMAALPIVHTDCQAEAIVEITNENGPWPPPPPIRDVSAREAAMAAMAAMRRQQCAGGPIEATVELRYDPCSKTEYEMLLARIAELGHVNDMLARRCAEQARHIADLLSLNEEERTPPKPGVFAAIAIHQSQGVR